MSQEAALALAEKEKARAKAALEAAEEARKKAEQEAQRRKEVEMKARKEAEERNRVLTAYAQNDARYRRYTMQEIEVATEKFSPLKKIGEGGYGPVYKGRLDHTSVAIKILSPEASQGRKQFQQEVMICCNMHVMFVVYISVLIIFAIIPHIKHVFLIITKHAFSCIKTCFMIVIHPFVIMIYA